MLTTANVAAPNAMEPALSSSGVPSRRWNYIVEGRENQFSEVVFVVHHFTSAVSLSNTWVKASHDSGDVGYLVTNHRLSNEWNCDEHRGSYR